MSSVVNDSKSRLYRVVRSGSDSVAQAPTCTSISISGHLRIHTVAQVPTCTSISISGHLRIHSGTPGHQTEKGRDRQWGAGEHATVPLEAADREKEIQKYSCPLFKVARSA